MNSLWSNKEFCRDTFAESLWPEFKDEIVSRMLGARRRTHHMRLAGAACAIALLFCAAVLLRYKTAPRNQFVATVVRLTPPLPFAEVVRTIPLGPDMIVHTREQSVAIVHSDAIYDRISDEQMFELLRGRSVALVKVNGVVQLEILGP